MKNELIEILKHFNDQQIEVVSERVSKFIEKKKES